MPTLIELETPEANIEFCRELGLGLLEINMNLPYFQLEGLRNLRVENDIRYSLHLPEELNVWDFNDRIGGAYLDTVCETIEIAKEKGIKILNMHMNPGVYFTLPESRVFLFEQNFQHYISKTEAFAREMASLLKNTGIRIFIENTGINDLAFITAAVESLLMYDCFALTWDVGHDYSSGNKDLGFLKENKDRICHLHLHDAIGERNHLSLGEGDINIEEIFSLASGCESIILETKTAEALKISVDYFRSMSSIS